MAGLSGDQINFYREQGYLTVPDALALGTVERLSAIVEQWTIEASGVSESDGFFDLEDSHQASDPRVRRFKRPVRNHPEFNALARSDAVLDLISSLIGDAIRISPTDNKINIKAPEYGAAVEWHQDWAFYPYTNDDLLAIGIALDDCAEENGPLMVIPGSHKGPVHDHHTNGVFCGAIDPAASGIDFSQAVPLTGRRGTMTIHHARTIHGSALNTSANPRRLLLIMYAAADAWPLLGVSDLEDFNSDMARGAATLVPRMTEVPVRIPLPPPELNGSIYERQSILENKYFEVFDETPNVRSN
ncbi:MAG: phytanoyl-CoA dioxygenase family protein [Alphaproteobacteria bacterium]|nr:phytanoyl-CoA dioxygenase family protein [Alphaproteobacteria bacterium]